MTTSMFIWLEKVSGSTYDFSEDFERISKNFVYTSPYSWYISMANIIKNAKTALKEIDDNFDELTDDVPSRRKFKRIFTEYVRGSIDGALKPIKKSLGIKVTSVSEIDDYIIEVNALYRLIHMFTDEEIGTIIKKNLFGSIDEELGGVLTVKFEINPADLTTMFFTVNDIIEFESDED